MRVMIECCGITGGLICIRCAWTWQTSWELLPTACQGESWTISKQWEDDCFRFWNALCHIFALLPPWEFMSTFAHLLLTTLQTSINYATACALLLQMLDLIGFDTTARNYELTSVGLCLSCFRSGVLQAPHQVVCNPPVNWPVEEFVHNSHNKQTIEKRLIRLFPSQNRQGLIFEVWLSYSGDYERDMERLKTVLISRKTWNFDTESRTRVYDDLYRSCAQLAHAARMAMVAMLQVVQTLCFTVTLLCWLAWYCALWWPALDKEIVTVFCIESSAVQDSSCCEMKVWSSIRDRYLTVTNDLLALSLFGSIICWPRVPAVATLLDRLSNPSHARLL